MNNKIYNNYKSIYNRMDKLKINYNLQNAMADWFKFNELEKFITFLENEREEKTF